ncbi:signal peptidase I Serine peptidase. MEROPS family S26A [Streptomyces sp. DvalAA-14]|uniref:signal peptidase I n=1 Tax=unclassified Streptomyces TaxID=2593676 RepID=UPI00081B5E81|nr:MULTISPECIES: signal peptidase I [unclassified Streptomyces]MYS18901.1 signal peptidase I [Streptomyces sp. SID4948]SCD31584.1 signal peptidase I Serine peptidase. MEROPS family S26A [Streptomyces sp. DvalAA-14]
MGNRGKPRSGQPNAGPGADRAAADRSGTGSGSVHGDGEPGTSEPPLLTGTSRIERRKLARKVKRKRRRSLITEVPLLIVVALVIALVLKTFLLQAFVIPSGSMEQTIQIGDRVLVDKLTPWFGTKPQRGDVVVFQDPGGWLAGEPQSKPDPVVVKQIKQFFTFIGLLPASGEQDLIKRVIGVGGDTVQCCDKQGRILVNGKPLTEPYVYPGNPPSMMKFTVHVPQGRLWVMGDHRSDSADSRYHTDQPGGGTIPENLVVGRAFVIAWPVGHWTRLKEPGTFSSVPDPPAASAAGTAGPTRVGTANNGDRTNQLPTPAELPFVVGVVGLRRKRGKRRSGVRSGCGGPRGGRTVWIRRARKGEGRGAFGAADIPGAARIRPGVPDYSGRARPPGFASRTGTGGLLGLPRLPGGRHTGRRGGSCVRRVRRRAPARGADGPGRSERPR